MDSCIHKETATFDTKVILKMNTTYHKDSSCTMPLFSLYKYIIHMTVKYIFFTASQISGKYS